MSTRLRWLVLYTRPRYEKKVARQLTERGIEHFLPLREVMRQWSDRKKLVEAPLFPGYIFVHVDERQRIQALETDGAMKYIHFNGRVAEVRQATIDALCLVAESRAPISIAEAGLALGADVHIRTGPLAGLRGRIVAYRGSYRVGVLVEALQQLVIVEASVTDLLPPIVSE